MSRAASADSLLNALGKSKADSTRVLLLTELSGAPDGKDASKKLAYAREALSLSIRINYPKGIAISSSLLSGLLEADGAFDSSRVYLLRARQALEKSGNKKALGMVLGNLGAHFYKLSEPKEAIGYFQKALDIFEMLNDSVGVAKGEMNIAAIHKNMGNYKDALLHYAKSEDIYRQLGDEVSCAEIKLNRGAVYKKQLLFDLALKEYLPALQIAEKFQNKRLISKLYNNIGNIHLEKKEFDTALAYYDKCVPLRLELNDYQGLTITYSNMALIYNDQGKYDKAIGYLEKCEQLSLKMKDKENLMYTYREFSRAYEGKKDYQKAFRYVNLYAAYRDTLVNDKSNEAVTEMEKRYETERKDKELLKKDVELARRDVEAKQQQMVRNLFMVGLAVVLIIFVFVYRGYRQKMKANRIISAQKQEVELQKLIVEEKNREIVDSINYARRIQYALLAHEEVLKANLGEYFIFFKPKDIVSGDFYWAARKDDRFYFAVCDSTGHGVPGAFMSLLNISFLNEAINEKKIAEPHLVLNHVRERLIKNVSQEGNRDGMDAVLVCFQKNVRTVMYAAANNAPVLLNKAGLSILATDKMPVGKGEKMDSFTLHSFEPEKGDFLFLYTDGYADQFGGEKGKKFKYKELNNLLVSISQEPVGKQKELLADTLERWKGSLEQVDDICITGIRL